MTFVLTLLSTFVLLIGILYFGWRKPAYNHWRNTISELGEVGSPVAKAVSYGLFLPVGLLLWLVAALAESDVVTGLAGCIGAGYVVAAFFPCDVGSPLPGSSRQQIHNLGGAIEYIGGVYFVGQISSKLLLVDYNPFIIAATSVVAGSILLSVPGLSVRGLVQRIIEVILFVSLLVISY